MLALEERLQGFFWSHWRANVGLIRFFFDSRTLYITSWPMSEMGVKTKGVNGR